MVERSEKESGESSAIEDQSSWPEKNGVEVRIGRAALKALVDTGSPVSLMRYSTYAAHMTNKELAKIENCLTLRRVNRSVIAVRKRIVDRIVFENIRDAEFNIELFVVNDQTMEFNVLSSRQFFNSADLKLSYQNRYSVVSASGNEVKLLTIFTLKLRRNNPSEMYC